MEACWRGDHCEVQRLLSRGADVNAQNENGTTPLMYAKTYAFSSGDTRIMSLLIECGAKLSLQDKAGKTAADYTRERAELILSKLEPINEPEHQRSES